MGLMSVLKNYYSISGQQGIFGGRASQGYPGKYGGRLSPLSESRPDSDQKAFAEMVSV
jgi:hypothetical protein